MIYNIDTCIVWCSANLGWGKNWLTHCQDNLTECEIGSWYRQPGIFVGQHYKVAMLVHRHKSVSILDYLFACFVLILYSSNI